MGAMIEGFRRYPGYLRLARQEALLHQVKDVLALAPLFRPRMPRTGRPFSVEMSNAGPLGWYSDEAGYRYVERHPETGLPWPPIPPRVLALWRELEVWPELPEACLINYYRDGARLGLHQDKDEASLAPILSISLGEAALFRIGPRRSGPTLSIRLESGDVLVMAGPARSAFHGIERIEPGSNALTKRFGFAEGGRINLTLRRVHLP
jgi:alkylated DNA repair protein (DNA oxidative demethylase)